MITKRKIITDFAVYYLRKDFCIIVVYGKSGNVQVAHEELPVTGFGITLEEAIQDFCDMFDVQYQGLVNVNSENDLTRDAKRARKLFLEIVEGVYLINDRTHTKNVCRADDEITAKIPEETLKAVKNTSKRKK